MASTASTDLPFAIVPEWLVDADCSDRAFRVYALLARFADSDGSGAIPGRRRMAERLRCSVDTIDRAVAELIDLGAVEREYRFEGGRQTSNAYVVRRIPPGESGTDAAPGGSGTDAADGSGTNAAGGSGTNAAPVPIASMTESHKTENNTSSLAAASDSTPRHRVDLEQVGSATQRVHRSVTNPTSVPTPRHRVDPEKVWSADVLALTRELAVLVRDNGHALPSPGSKAADGWYDAMEKLLRLGPPGDTGDDPAPTVDEVRAVMRWALAESDFWPANVRSAAKLREKFTMLRAQAQRTTKQPPGVALAAGYADAAARLRSRG